MEDLTVLRAALDDQREKVRALKDAKASKEDLSPEITKLNDLKKKVEAAEAAAAPKNPLFEQRRAFEDLLRRRFIVGQAFEIYGGVAGLYDYGPPGAAMKDSLIQFWRQHFVLEENMLELECTCLTPDPVLRASGHVDRFTDYMVKDTVTSECYRADKLVEEFVSKTLPTVVDKDRRSLMERVVRDVDTYSQEELKEAIRAIGLVSEAGNPVSDPFPFNLMFGTQIGPSGHIPGFLRPETAQGIFVNFKRLLDFNGGRLPFGAATIGQAFRNEIAPRSGLLRVREFTLAEIEYFVHPDREHRRHAKFALSGVKNLQVPLLTREAQAAGGKALLMTLGDAVDAGVIDNETLAYFIGRTAQFLIAAGLTRPLEQFRFRQHRANEMAHYANDCWDAEIFTSYGFVECVGIADRSCYDLTKHSEKSKVDLVAYERFETPVTAHVTHLKLDKAAIGKQYKKAGKAIEARIEAAAEDEKRALAEKLAVNGQIEVVIDGETFVLTKDVVQVQHREEKVHGRNFIPSVIEPSFGLGRILYSLLENAYYVRAGDDEQRAVLGLSPLIAPYKCVVLPLSGNEAFGPLVERVRKELTSLGISCKVDDSGSAIGRRYARSDEIGIPFGVTVDFQSVSDLTVTLRERDSCTQVRLPVADVGRVVRDLSYGNTTWAAVRNAYPEQAQTASELVGKKE